MLGLPSIAAVSPATFPSSGGVSVLISGTNLGINEGTVARVEIGGRLCSSVQVISTTSVQCIAPAGAGSQVDVSLVSSTAVAASGGVRLAGYAAPVITTVMPWYVLTGPDAVYNVTILGSNLAAVAAGISPSSVVVGGRECLSVVVLNDTAVMCPLMDASIWRSSLVVVQLED